jgi:hypothetical protein
MVLLMPALARLREARRAESRPGLSAG